MIKPTPRPMTNEECREYFVQCLLSLADYWADNSNVPDARDKCRGIAFSFLVMLDGGVTRLPAFNVSPAPHPDDAKYYREHGKNWWPDGLVFNDCQLHEIFHQIAEAKDAAAPPENHPPIEDPPASP